RRIGHSPETSEFPVSLSIMCAMRRERVSSSSAGQRLRVLGLCFALPGSDQCVPLRLTSLLHYYFTFVFTQPCTAAQQRGTDVATWSGYPPSSTRPARSSGRRRQSQSPAVAYTLAYTRDRAFSVAWCCCLIFSMSRVGGAPNMRVYSRLN